jgi:alginate O-acetyltransferase complex protein AlgI
VLFPTFGFFVFWLTAFGVYWLLPDTRLARVWLLLASAIFYAQWSAPFLLLIAASTSIDYVVSRRLPATVHAGTRRALLAASVAVNLGLLAAFKYAPLLAGTLGQVLALAGVPVPPLEMPALLPLGISFYTFEAISYVVDVYRGRSAPARSALEYALYILFFPHLVAGPIVRARELLPQLRRPRRRNWVRMELALRLFLTGLFKKVVIADHLARVADPVFARPEVHGFAATWLAVIAYAFQIYCDFSGYSDMAMGLAHSFGIRLPRNFRAPYLAGDVREFWTRWHITLSRWLRDYVYIPLGGSRGGEGRTLRNLLLTMGLGGLWHGASWTFALWGLYHGVLLGLHRAWIRHSGARLPALAATPLTFVAVCFGWVLFRAPSLDAACSMAGHMLAPMAGVAPDPADAGMVVLAVAGITGVQLLAARVDAAALASGLPFALRGALLAGVLLATQFLAPGQGSPFIYFQF